MKLNEIKEFLRNKPGYLKEGGKRLRKVLLSKNFTTTIKDCKEAIRQVRNEKLGIVKTNKPLKVLIYDIETSPNEGWFWRSGYKLNIDASQIKKERAIICLSYKWLDENEVYNLYWDLNQNDKFLIDQFIDVLNEADLIVAHNGENFDIKWLKTRALIHKLHYKMLPNYKQFDTLKVAKSKLYLNSNRLDYIAKILGFSGKIRTRYNLWDEVCYDNNRDSLKEMIEYCDEDVIQLEHVYKELQYLENPLYHIGVQNGETKQTSPITGTYNIEHVKTVTTNSGTKKHIMKDLDTGRLFEMSNTNYLKFLEINN